MKTWGSPPTNNIFALLGLSIIFITAFVYYNYYGHELKEHSSEFIKRVFTTYSVPFLIVALLLTLIEKASWSTNFLFAFSRTVIVRFPASMSVSVADMIK